MTICCIGHLSDTKHQLALPKNESKIQWVPSFRSMKSLLSKVQVRVSYIAFTPILPFPATDYDSINTVLVNFQDVLAQKQQPYGALWCDEGVYHIAKELQLLHENKFKNIFLGLGGFHMEKIALSAIGQYLSKIGARDISVRKLPKILPAHRACFLLLQQA